MIWRAASRDAVGLASEANPPATESVVGPEFMTFAKSSDGSMRTDFDRVWEFVSTVRLSENVKFALFVTAAVRDFVNLVRLRVFVEVAVRDVVLEILCSVWVGVDSSEGVHVGGTVAEGVRLSESECVFEFLEDERDFDRVGGGVKVKVSVLDFV